MGKWRRLIDMLKTLAEVLFLWFPFPVKTGLRRIGNPDRNAPVILTCNFDMTVRQVSNQLEGWDCFLLIANTKGINVWCSSVGGVFTSGRVINAIKVSRLRQRVDHRTVILPQLCAPGVNAHEVEKATGFKAIFGPVYVTDLPEFLSNGLHKTSDMRCVKNSIAERARMALTWCWMISLLGIPVYLIWNMDIFFQLVALIWFTGYTVFIFFPYLPGKLGILKGFSVGAVILLASLVYTVPIAHWPDDVVWRWCIGVFLVSLFIGFDSAGSTQLQRTRWEEGLARIGVRVGFTRKEGIVTKVLMDSNKCIACETCLEICPKQCLTIVDSRITWDREDECVQCTACVNQCPSGTFSVEKV